MMTAAQSPLPMSFVERLEDRLYGLAADASSTSRRLSRSSRTKRSKEVEALACILALLPQVAVHGWILISKGAINLTTELQAAVIGIFLAAVLVGVGQISLSGHRRLPLVLALAHTIGLVTSSAAVGPNASLLICGITAIASAMLFFDVLSMIATAGLIGLANMIYVVIAGVPGPEPLSVATVTAAAISMIFACWAGRRSIELSLLKRAQEKDQIARFEAQLLDRTEELRRSEIRKSAVVENALDCIIALDSKGHINEFNSASERVFSRERDDMRGQSFLKLFPSKHWDLIMKTLQAAASRSDASSILGKRVELVALRPNGEEFPIELTLTSARLTDEGLLTAFVRDLSEQKTLESKLAHAQKMESIGEMSAGIAHEINTPNQYIADNIEFIRQSFEVMSQVVKGYEEFLEAGQRGDDVEAAWNRLETLRVNSNFEMLAQETPDAIAQAQEGVERVRSIVRAMKDFAHPGAQAMAQVDLNQVINSTLTISRNEWKTTAHMQLNLDPSLPVVPGRPSELGQVILNMVVNAVHAIREKHGSGQMGEIEIATRVKDDAIELMIRDNGNGIPASAQKKIFDPFFTTKGVGIGTGQGLAISHNVIVGIHGGDIRFVTKEGEGTAFIIKLPRYQAENQRAGVAA
jgi:PAS domain S-box-containing protein